MRGFTVIVLGQKGTETQEKIQDFEMEAGMGKLEKLCGYIPN